MHNIKLEKVRAGRATFTSSTLYRETGRERIGKRTRGTQESPKKKKHPTTYPSVKSLPERRTVKG